MNLVRLSNTPRPSSTAASMVEKSSSVSTMSAASLATSVPPWPMATPMLALSQCGRVVDPVTGHGDDVPAGLQCLDETQLLLGRDPGEHDRVVDRLGVVVGGQRRQLATGEHAPLVVMSIEQSELRAMAVAVAA